MEKKERILNIAFNSALRDKEKQYSLAKRGGQ
jgi:hypothetical protein